MKKHILFLPFLLTALACGIQAQPVPGSTNIVDPTPTVVSSPGTIPPAETLPATPLPDATSTNPPLIPTQASAGCAANWFFTFNAEHTALGSFCPEPALTLEAIGQDFEGGRVLRYAADPSYTADQRGTIYIIYNDGEWLTYPDAWDASQPSSDPGIIPPADRYQPTDGIGKVWRENVDVRHRLGWAYEPAAQFTGRMQVYLAQANAPSGDTHYFFIDHGKWGLALLLNAVDMGPNQWEVAGTYP